MPNTFAYFMLLIWPVVMLAMFRRLSMERALIWSILGGYLLLPPIAGFDAPLVPLLDKFSIPNVTAFAICTLLLGQRISVLPVSRVGRLLLLLFIATPIVTVFTNTEPILFAVGGLPGLRIYDSFSSAASHAITILPFFLARKLLATERAQHEILVALVVAGLAYSIPMLIEVRLSPQMNVWFYGFFQHGFDQMMRYGGFRPIVFLEHGLWVAFFALMTFAAAVALSRLQSQEKRSRYVFVALYLGVVLVLCKSAGPLIYALGLMPLIIFGGRKLQIRVAALLALVVVAYPLLRGWGIVPVEAIVSLVSSIDTERAGSLQFRIDNEEMLLAHARDKAMFGWGAWERNFVFDYATGYKVTTVDGRWIIVMGVNGWFGYLSEFGLLALPLLLLARQAGRLPKNALSRYAGPLSLIFAANLVDLLPNATLVPFTWLLGGAMLGYAEALKARGSSEPELRRSHGFRRASAPGLPGVRSLRRAGDLISSFTAALFLRNRHLVTRC
ncbi:hypothetical protein LHFGNBLO_001687 [Mesorhizobium sp. AR10]|uniref:hypothetical protein n=1 Tax=Mesorhizobium sp. AR10 TaxID=2865839 RepID=UPI0021607E58|nr:hypothetical protein [Mesorhizobium sp. AR10]UVK40243.1 hypothetical protein LHFGNBLO_001687 [Mesorhizobium sp. AR10]